MSSEKDTPGIRLPAERPGEPGGARARNREARVNALLEAAGALFLEQGIDPVTIDAITKKAGTAKGSFYRYFDSKDHLVEVLIQPVRDQVLAAVDTCYAEVDVARTAEDLSAAYTNLTFALVPTLLEHEDLVRLYLQENRGAPSGPRAPLVALSRALAERSTNLTAVAVEHGLVRDLDPEVIAGVVIGGVENLLHHHLAVRRAEDPLSAAAEVVSLILEGIGARD